MHQLDNDALYAGHTAQPAAEVLLALLVRQLDCYLQTRLMHIREAAGEAVFGNGSDSASGTDEKVLRHASLLGGSQLERLARKREVLGQTAALA